MRLFSILLVSLIFCGCATQRDIFRDTNQDAYVDVFFSPTDNLEKVWLETINLATNRIYVSCFGLFNTNIWAGLKKKNENGVEIVVCVDRVMSKAKGSQVTNVANEDIEIVVKKTTVFEHNKFIVVDGKHAIIGSYNLSERAQLQDNSLVLFINQPAYAQKIEKNFMKIYARDK